MTIRCEVTEWFRDGGSARNIVQLDRGILDSLLARLASAWSATLSCEIDLNTLVVYLSEGRAAIFLDAGEDEFFDLVGAPGTDGDCLFVAGGQAADQPARHVFGLSIARDLLREVVDSGHVDKHDPRWERQK